MRTLSATKRALAGMDGEMRRKNQKNLLRQTRILRKMGNKSTKIDGEVKKMKKSLHRKMLRTCGRDTVNLSPGMATTVEIKTGTRRVIEYFLSTLLQYQHESLRER